MINSTWFKRMVAVVLVFTLALISPMQFVKTEKSEAASKNVKYIKEFKLFIKKQGGQEDAEDWCKSQTDGDWHVVEGDLNDGTNGAFSKPVGVFLCYTTTDDAKEAVTDIAVMNEKGNYSESAYEAILKDQRDSYKDLVKNLKIQVKGYQENYTNKVKTAIEAHDALNGFKEDDSDKLLGDLLAELDLEKDSDADKLTDILLQANGQVVLFIQQELSLACESGTRSWLDRMEQVGGYDKFYDKIKTAFNGDDVQAKRNMDAKYKERATVIADDWDNLKSHLENIKKYEIKNDVGTMTEEQLKTWKENNLSSAEGMAYEQEVALATNLASYNYEGKTLLDFFNQDKSEISGDKLYKLYPMAACLQAGQFAGIDSTVNLYSLINQAFSATMLNDYNKGKQNEVKAEMDEGQKKEWDDLQEKAEKVIDQQKKTGVKSIYEGVDREIFNGGVAVTSDALEYSKGSENKWTDYLVDHGKTIQSIATISFCTGALANIFLYAGCGKILHKKAVDILNNLHGYGFGEQFSDGSKRVMGDLMSKYQADKAFRELEKMGNEGNEYAAKATDQLYKMAGERSSTGSKILNGLAKGMTVVLILAAAADIAVNVYALYQYYNRDHLPVPKRMIDMSTNKAKETSYVTYKTVKDNNGEPGDLNGGEAKQWLALYQTKDDRAGQPIAAPESGYQMKVLYGENTYEDSYSPLHMFGKPNAAQNLTFADGESGWSYNDKNFGTYLFFAHYDGKTIDEEETKEVVSEKASEDTDGNALNVTDGEDVTKTDDAEAAGTVITGGGIALIAGGVVVVLGFAFFAINNSRKRKKEE